MNTKYKKIKIRTFQKRGHARSDKEAVLIQCLSQTADKSRCLLNTLRTGPAQGITCPKYRSQPPVMCSSQTT